MRGSADAPATPATPLSPVPSSSPAGFTDTAPGFPPPSGRFAGGERGSSDADLLAAHVAGDPHAFTTLVHRHHHRLWATALRMMRNPHDAADALQDAYLAAFRRAEGFRGEAQVTTWLHRIVVNACLDRLRRRQRLLTERPLPDDPERLAELVSPAVSDPVGHGELYDELSEALAELNSGQRAALVLVDVEGYAVEQAAAILGVPAGTVKSRCARGRARLAVRLRERRAPGCDSEVASGRARGAGAVGQEAT